MIRYVQEDAGRTKTGNGWASVPFNRETGEALKPVRVNGHMTFVVDDYTALCSVFEGEWSIYDYSTDETSLFGGSDADYVPAKWRRVVKHALRRVTGRTKLFYHEL